MVENDSRLVGQKTWIKHLLFALFFFAILSIANLSAVACSGPSDQSRQYPLPKLANRQNDIIKLAKINAIGKLAANQTFSWSASVANITKNDEKNTVTVHSFTAKPEFALRVYEVLRDPQGWMRTGILFENSSYNTLDSDIIFIIDASNSTCDATTVACMAFSQNTCLIIVPLRVIVNFPLLAQRNGLSEKEYMRRLVNHELGHCLGLDHSTNTTDIMYTPYAGAVYPSVNEIIQIKSLAGKNP